MTMPVVLRLAFSRLLEGPSAAVQPYNRPQLLGFATGSPSFWTLPSGTCFLVSPPVRRDPRTTKGMSNACSTPTGVHGYLSRVVKLILSGGVFSRKNHSCGPQESNAVDKCMMTSEFDSSEKSVLLCLGRNRDGFGVHHGRQFRPKAEMKQFHHTLANSNKFE